MESFSNLGPDTWLLVARAFLIFAAFSAFAWALLRMRRESAEQSQQVVLAQRELTAQIHALSERVAALATLVATQPRRAAPPAQPVSPQPTSQLPVEAPAPPVTAPRRHSGVPSYETAKRLARSGASVEEIVATCGLAGTEARLLQRLHAAEARPGRAA